MMLHDDHGVSLVDKTMEHRLEKFHISGMQSDRRLFQNIECASTLCHAGAFRASSAAS